MSKQFPHECDHDAEVEATDIAEQEAHDAGECLGYPRCNWCILEDQERRQEYLEREREQEERETTQCDCWDVHQNLNLDAYTCGCECHRKWRDVERLKDTRLRG